MDLQQLVRQRPDASRIAFELEKLPSPQSRQPLIDEVLSKGMNTKDVIDVVERMLRDFAYTQAQTEQKEASSFVKNEQGSEIPVLKQQEDTLESPFVPSINVEKDTKQREDVQPQIPSSPAFQDVSAQLAILEQKQKSQMKKDGQTLQQIIERWSEWTSKPAHNKNELHTYVIGWIAQLQTLEDRLKP